MPACEMSPKRIVVNKTILACRYGRMGLIGRLAIWDTSSIGASNHAIKFKFKLPNNVNI
jgi:hypothetical protein